jgi:NitT/TauT family transport system substrate-binding protein
MTWTTRIVSTWAVFLTFIVWPGAQVSAQLTEPKKITLSYSSLGTAMMPSLIAQANGYYQAEGLSLQMLLIQGAISVTALMSGSVDFITDMSSSLEAAVRGPKFKVLLVFGDRPVFELIARAPIKTFADLKGKTLGVSSLGSASDMITRTMLTKNGLQPDRDVTIRAVGTLGNRFIALKTGAIDASIMTPPYNFLALKELGVFSLGKAGDYMQALQGGIITVGDFVSSNPDVALRFVRASLKGHLFYRVKRQESVALMMEKLKLTDHAIAQQVYDFHNALTTPDGTIPSSLARTVIDDRRHFAKVSRPINPDEIFDFTFARRAMSDLKAAGWQP